MSPELADLLILVLRMAVAAAFVVSASFITEHSGPAIGALVATLPISAGPAYVFLALDHDAAFIAQGALTSLPISAATVFLGLTYTLLAQRHSLLISYGAAAMVWIVIAAIVGSAPLSLWEGILLNVVTFAICTPLMQRYRHARMPPIARRWYDVPLRASLVATLIATIVTLSGRVGPSISGLLAVFPAVFSSMILILHPRIGGPATAAVIANSAWGMMGFGLALVVLHLGALHLGSAAGLSLALATCVGWNLMLWQIGRRRAAVAKP